MRGSLTILWLGIVVTACKPSSEPPRRATSAGVTLARGPELGEPPAAAVRVTETPPEVTAVVGPGVDAGATPSDASDDAGPRPDDAAPEGELDDADAADDVDDDATPSEIVDDLAPEGDLEIGPEIVADEDSVAGVEDAAPAADDAIDVASIDLAPIDPAWDALVASLSRDADADQQERARALNKSGLEKHRKHLYGDAIADYRAALEAWPAHPFSRYNLACALALEHRPDDALRELAVLGHLAESQTAARDRLRAARIDSDFESLREDARFRGLTGATDILVAWARDDDRAEAKRLTELLRGARWLARSAPRAWNATQSLPPYDAVIVQADDPVARAVADEITATLIATRPGMTKVDAGVLPPEAAPIVVWLAPPAARAPDPEPPPETPTPPEPVVPVAPSQPSQPHLELKEIKDFIGHRLIAPGATPEFIELKPTGFFAWEIGPASDSGIKVTRTGRYQLRGPSLSLTYKETTTTPDPAGPPHIEVHEGRTSTVLLTVPEAGTLAIEARPFHPL